MRRYDQDMDSGIEWLGKVPNHWECKRLKDLAHVVLGKMLQPNSNGNDSLKPYLRSLNVQWEKVDVEDVKEMWLTNYEMQQYKLKRNDIVVSEGGEIGRAALWRDELDECYIQNSVHKVTAFPLVVPEFLLYQFVLAGKSGHFEKIVNRVSIAHLTREKLVSVSFVKPPFTEQASIAAYLDESTSKLDQLIKNKTDQIARLQEIRQIEINRAVTKGLNPDAEMKDSGIEWLGEVPKHWGVKRLTNLTTKIGSGVTPSGGADVYQSEGIPLFRSQNIHFDKLRLDDIAYISEEIHNEMSNSKVKENDVLLNITGASIGRCNFIPKGFGEANVNQHVCIIRLDNQLIPEFLYYFLSSDLGQQQIMIGLNGSSRDGLTFQAIKNFKLAFPKNKDEQRQVVRHLVKRVSSVDKLVHNLQTQIEKLHEIRKIEIYNAVTGKINVT